MSLTKDMMMEDEPRSCVDIIESLINGNVITHLVSVGVANIIIKEGNLDSLSPAQRKIFDTYIAPAMNLHCDRCEESIPVSDYPKYFGDSEYHPEVICEPCSYFRSQMAKDD